MTGFSATLASVISVYTQLPGLKPNPLVHVVGGSSTDFTTLAPTLLSAISDLETDTAGNPPAVTALAPAVGVAFTLAFVMTVHIAYVWLLFLRS